MRIFFRFFSTIAASPREGNLLAVFVTWLFLLRTRQHEDFYQFLDCLKYLYFLPIDEFDGSH